MFSCESLIMKNILTLLIVACFATINGFGKTFDVAQDTINVDREFVLSASMLGYFGQDGARNPILRAQKGENVRIKIINAEQMTHDITLEKGNIKSPTIFEKNSTTSIVFIARENDTYYCSIPGHRAAGMVGKLQVVDQLTETLAGQLPKVNSKPLNLDFETGNLNQWNATGDAFSDGIVNADPSPLHSADMKIGFSGKYFVSSGGTKNYTLTGTLTSVPFLVSEPFAAFKVSGGALQDTRVELVRKDTQEVIFHITGNGKATLLPVVVDLNAVLNREIFIRIIDNETGISQIPYIKDDIWAHINFDDFKFYSTRPSFTNELKPEDIIVLPPLDPVLHAGLSGLEAAKSMTLPKGFKVTLAAAEPDIIRPISFTIDPKGRLWVVEAHTYPTPAVEGQGKDRILIMEDTNGDGTLDKKTVFMEGLNMVAGIEYGMGGVWLCAAPYLLFIPVDSKTDKPAGPPQKLLDGWGLNDTHEIANSIRWGPDGWLYGTHGVFTHSNVGKPGAPDDQRTKINAGVWRFHPATQKFEVFAEGSSNPWGIDFNEYGHPFITVCVIPHMYHIIQGARYQRQAGKHFNPYTYDDIKTIADHVHWVGNRGPHAGNFRSGSAGGGHAHAGAMIYLGGNNWPSQYKNEIFMNNINGAKVNIDRLERVGSGYTATHQTDFLSTNDSWSQWLNMKYDQNGSVYAIDWYDKNQCHSPNPDVHDKTLGRIFKISYEKDSWVKVDLTKANNKELVQYQLSENEWYVRHARQLLQERGANKQVHRDLKKILNDHPDVTRKLRALWALHVTHGLTEAELVGLLSNSEEYIRSWAIQLLAESQALSKETLTRLTVLSKNENSALVRVYLVSAMLRLPEMDRWGVMEHLLQNKDDVVDHNLPLMYWYALEPLVGLDMTRALKIAEITPIPNILNYTIKRLGAIGSVDSKSILEQLHSRLKQKEHSAANHESMQLIDKVLKE